MDNNNFQEIESMLNDFKIMSQPTVQVTVKLQPSTMIADLAQCYASEIRRIIGITGTHEADEFSVEEIRQYISTLIWIRCCHVEGVTNKSYDLYKRFNHCVAVPILVAIMIRKIGKACDLDYGIQFVPDTTIDKDDLLDPDRLLKFSNFLFGIQNKGFRLVGRLPKETDGCLDFMAMHHVAEQVVSYRKGSLENGFFAAFFRQEQLNKITGTMCRLLYGYEQDYRIMLAAIVSKINKSGGGTDVLER